jgi:hypothetical protein
VSRDAMIRQLRHALEERIVRNCNGDAEHFPEADSRMLLDLTADLKQRLATTESRCPRSDETGGGHRSGVGSPTGASAAVYAHGVLNAIETEEARAMPGVSSPSFTMATRRK